MTNSQPIRYAHNPALTFIRSTDNEVIVRFGSRGQASRRLRDDASRGVLSDIVWAFQDGADPKEVEERFGEAASELIAELVEAGLLLRVDQLQHGFLVAGYGVDTPGIQSLRIIGEGKFADLCRKLLADALGDTVAIDRAARPEPQDEPADFTVCVADSPNVGLFYDMNEYAITYGAAWHAAPRQAWLQLEPVAATGADLER